MEREEEKEYIKKPPSYGRANYKYPVVSVRISRKMKMAIKHFKGSRPYREVILEGLRKFYEIEEEKEKAYNRGYMQGKEDFKQEMARKEVEKNSKKGKESVERAFGSW